MLSNLSGFARALLAGAAFFGACSPAKTPGPAAPTSEPARASPSAAADAGVATGDAAAPAVEAGVAALGPSCMPAELRAEGRVVAVELASDGAVDFCVKKGFVADSPKVCLRLRPAEKRFESTTDLWPGIRFAERPDDAADTASAVEAHAAGTLHVCSDREHCTTLRLRPPERDAWDEVYGGMPAVAAPGSSRVLVARAEERYPRPSGRATFTVYVDAVDVARGAKVGSALVARNVSPIQFLWLGEKALLEGCELDGGPCSAWVIDPKSLAAKKLPVELDRPSSLGTGHMSELVLRAGPGAWVLIDAQGRAAIWVDAAGAVTRRLDLGASTQARGGIPRAGFGSDRELWVLQAGPSAGRVSLIDPATGSVTHFDAPACP